MERVCVTLPKMKEYKMVYVLTIPGIVYINVSANVNANLVLIVRTLEK